MADEFSYKEWCKLAEELKKTGKIIPKEFLDYIKLYENGVGGVESKTSTVWTNSYSFGEYYVFYEVEDSSGNHIKEFSKIFKITKDSPVEIIME